MGKFATRELLIKIGFLLMSSESEGNANYQAMCNCKVDSCLLSRLVFFKEVTVWAKNISDAQGSIAPTVFAKQRKPTLPKLLTASTSDRTAAATWRRRRVIASC